MLDAYFAAACVGLLIALAITVTIVNQQIRQIAYWKAAYSTETRKLNAERSEILTDVDKLESLLKAARKNDNRDTKGRYAKA